MKKFLLILAALMAFTLPVPAARAEFVGGYLHTWVNPQEVNNLIGCFNDNFTATYRWEGEEEVLLREISGLDGFYLGLTSALFGLDSAFKYEYLNFFTRAAGEYARENPGDAEYTLDINGNIYGCCLEIKQELSRDLSLLAGIGYYSGIGSVDFTCADYYYQQALTAGAGAAPRGSRADQYRSHYDLAFGGTPGYKIGAVYRYDIGNGIGFAAGAGYRFLVMKVESEPGDLEGQSGPIFYEGEIPEDLTLDLSGLEINLGFSFAF